MIDIATAKEPVRCYLEKSDAGAVCVYLKAMPDGSYVAQREWFLDPAQAKQEFDTLDAEKVGAKLALIDARLEPVKDPIIKGG